MNILFVSELSFKNVGFGGARVLHEHSIRLKKKGHTIYVLTRMTDGESLPLENVEGVIVHRYYVDKSNQLNFLISSWKNIFFVFNRLSRQIKFDLINFHQPISSLAVNLSPRAWRIPKIYTFLSLAFKEYETRIQGGVKRNWTHKINSFFLRVIEKFCLGRCSKIVVLSEFSRQQLISYHKISPTKIKIIPGGVDVDRFVPVNDRALVREKLNIPIDKFILLTVRNLVPRMGIENLLKSMALVTKERDDIYLIIGGVGSLERKLKQLTSKLNLNKFVRFEGFIPEEHLSLYYQSADVFILPTKFLEGFGLVTLEALSSGLPVLGTPVGGTKEILGKLDPFLLFPDTSPESMANSISRYIKYPRLEELGKRCREFVVRNYSWDNAITEFDKLIKME